MKTTAEKKIDEKMTFLKEAFELIDKNADGEITSEELSAFFETMGDKLNKGEIQDMINEVDIEGNGSITFEGFKQLMDRKLRDDDIEEEIIETFKKFDQDNNGLIGTEEVFNLLNSFGQNITRNEAEDMIRMVDLDCDGFVNYQEFIKMLFGDNEKEKDKDKGKDKEKEKDKK